MSSSIYYERVYTTDKLSNQVVIGPTLDPGDIDQGMLGDCYFLSGISAMAQLEYDYRLRGTILTDDVNDKGVFGMQAYVMGTPFDLVVDDIIPFSNFGTLRIPVFTQQADDNSLYAMLLEKAWAKVNGFYESTVGGSTDEFFDFVSAVPTEYFQTSDRDTINSDPEKLFQMVGQFVQQGYPVSGGVPPCTPEEAAVSGLVCAHAYSVHGAANVTTADGGYDLLISVRNPHGKDNWYGAYNDTSAEMTDAVKEQLNFEENANDGYVWMRASDYITYFNSLYVGYYRDNYWNNYMLMENLSNTTHTFSVTFTQDQEQAFIGVQFYNSRMYPRGCKARATTAIMWVRDSSNSCLCATYVYDWNLMNGCEAAYSAGTYTVEIQMNWQEVDVPDLTLRVVASEQMSISQAGFTSDSVTLLKGKHDDISGTSSQDNSGLAIGQADDSTTGDISSDTSSSDAGSSSSGSGDSSSGSSDSSSSSSCSSGGYKTCCNGELNTKQQLIYGAEPTFQNLLVNPDGNYFQWNYGVFTYDNEFIYIGSGVSYGWLVFTAVKCVDYTGPINTTFDLGAEADMVSFVGDACTKNDDNTFTCTCTITECVQGQIACEYGFEYAGNFGASISYSSC